NRPIATISDSEQYPTGDAVRYSGGTLVKTTDSEQIYLILGNGTRYAFRSMEEFARFGYTLSQVRTVNQGDLDSYPLSDLNALPYHSNGTFIKYRNDPTVYLMENQTKRPITSSDVFLYHSNFSDVLEIPGGFQYQTGDKLAFPEGSLIKGSDPAIYLISGGVRQTFSSEQALKNYGYSLSHVRTVSDGDVNLVPLGSAI
ncbi:MAG: hypothetical protein ACM3NH_04180, partial [Candidatus Saccharibacteria bacterium]